MPLHTSLWDAASDAPLMAPAAGQDASSGFSELGAHWVAGQLHTAEELAWCFAPYVNSYRRYVPELVGADRRGVGRGQPDLRLPGRRAAARAGGWRTGSPART